MFKYRCMCFVVSYTVSCLAFYPVRLCKQKTTGVVPPYLKTPVSRATSAPVTSLVPSTSRLTSVSRQVRYFGRPPDPRLTVGMPDLTTVQECGIFCKHCFSKGNCRPIVPIGLSNYSKYSFYCNSFSAVYALCIPIFL